MPELRPYQADAVSFIAQNRRVLLALPPGAGKTATASTALKGRTLVVAPSGPVLRHWKAEYQSWTGQGAALAAGTKAQREKAYASSWPMIVTNYEAFRTDIEGVLAMPWDSVVFDESHRLKNRKSLTFKCASKLVKQVDQLILVTGTPVLNRADELWTSLHLMDPGKYRSFWRWAEYHFHIVFPRYRRRVVREICKDRTCQVCAGKGLLPGHVEMIRREIGGRMFYRPIEEILPDLPPVTETYHEVELTTAERKAYDSMYDNFWMEVGDEIIQAPNAIAKQTRLRQLASDWSCWGEPAGTKAKTAAALVNELDGEQALVFCAFRGTAEATAALIDGDTVTARAYHGGLSADKRSQLEEAFKSGEIDVLVATVRTLGEGVDGLQTAARNVIFIDRDWTPARNEQAWRRLARLGQKQAVNVIHIVASDTIDQVVAHALDTKADVIASVIESRAVPAR